MAFRLLHFLTSSSHIEKMLCHLFVQSYQCMSISCCPIGLYKRLEVKPSLIKHHVGLARQCSDVKSLTIGASAFGYEFMCWLIGKCKVSCCSGLKVLDGV